MRPLPAGGNLYSAHQCGARLSRRLRQSQHNDEFWYTCAPNDVAGELLNCGKNRTVIDGPFTETKELIAGFWVWQVRSMEEAVEWLKRCPNPHNEETELEIRLIFEAEDFGPEMAPELKKQEERLRA